MNEYLKQRRAQLRAKLEEYKVQLREKTLTDDQLKQVQEASQAASDELDKIAKLLGDGAGSDNTDDTGNGAGSDDPETNSGEDDNSEDRSAEPGDDPAPTPASEEARNHVRQIISRGLSFQSHENDERREKRTRTVFSRMVLGQTVDGSEARELGITTGNGAVTIPTTIENEILSYAQEENGLRQFGSVHQDSSTESYPVLVKKPTANGHSDERALGDDIPDGTIELDDVNLNPIEFDALVTYSKKLAHRSGINIENEIISELAKAYTAKEAEFMYTGKDAKNLNAGSLLNKAVAFKPTATDPFDQFIQFKNNMPKEIRKNAMFFMNTAAQTVVETLKDLQGRPLFRPMDALENGQITGVDARFMGQNAHITDYLFNDANMDSSVPALYFGDPKSFHIQDVLGSMEVMVLKELYSRSNHIGVQIYNLLDGQLIYSPLQPTFYRLDLTAAAGDETPKP